MLTVAYAGFKRGYPCALMRFCLVDAIVSFQPPSDPQTGKGASITTLKHVTNAEEYLQDHFPTFPVLPGVLMLEAFVQAARVLCSRDECVAVIARGGVAGVEDSGAASPLVLSRVRAFKYGAFMPPGSTLRVTVTLTGVNPDGSLEFKGEAGKDGSSPGEGEPDQTAAAGRFTMRTVKHPTLIAP
jgi:3-hydroxymyristoyl/3-hydroxydecanoyl-(acyl carrier protein) dehydratase